MERENRLAVGAGIVLLAIAGVVVAVRVLVPKPPPPKPAVAAPVTPAPAPAPAPPSEVSLPGSVQAASVVSVPAPVDGTVENLLADVGEDVARGQVLAQIKNPKLEQGMMAAQMEIEHARTQIAGLESGIISARLEVSRSQADSARATLELQRAEKEYQRQKMMMSEGVTPRLVFEKAQQEYNRLKSEAENLGNISKSAAERVDAMSQQLDEAHRTLDKRTVELQQAQLERTAGEVASPADGVVVARHAEAGADVTRAVKDLFQIATDVTSLQVVVSAEPETLKRIHAGQPATIEIPEAEATAEGKVKEIQADQVTVEFKSPAPVVRPGMSARVKIKLS